MNLWHCELSIHFKAAGKSLHVIPYFWSTFLGDCTFDTGMCGWTNMKNGNGAGFDVFDWTSNKGPTGSARTGPNADHTK